MTLGRVLLVYRRPIIVLLHLVLIVLSNYAAFMLRFEGVIPAWAWYWCVRALPWLLAIRLATFAVFRLYEGLWRYAGLWDLRNIVVAVGLSSGLFALVTVGLTEEMHYPHSILLIDAMLLVVLMGGLRFGRRLYRELGHLSARRRVVLYGAGDAGELLLRDIRNNPYYEYEVVGFIDDDPGKTGQRIHGVKVLGTRSVLPRVMADLAPDAILISIARTEPSTLRSIVRALEPFKIPIMVMPNLRDVVSGRLRLSDARTLSPEDLLERAPVGLDAEPVRSLIEHKRVLVTGAGGSIGSELSRQLALLAPATLVLLDRYENGLHAIAGELRSTASALTLDTVVADVTDSDRMESIMAAHRPQIVFHAAAHKHVPLMELNPCEAVKNNVRGTRVVAQMARRHGVERFVLISTDKAVNPTSVMGATKRVAELVIQALNGDGGGAFRAVRFGNVLASNGSVVPHFLEQIKIGGPVTVTHPDMRRYFMLTSEAVHLVLRAATLGSGGEVFVLDMGEQMRVVDLARNLIRLSGFVPDVEIPIRFIGVRPGEKLAEELVEEGELAQPTTDQRVSRVRPSTGLDRAMLDGKVAELERLAGLDDGKGVIEVLRDIVPTYHPGSENFEDAVVPDLATRTSLRT